MDRALVKAFYQAALFMKDRVDNHGWRPTSNYLREHVRATTGLRFSNTKSPDILRVILAEHPELRPYIEIAPKFERA